MSDNTLSPYPWRRVVMFFALALLLLPVLAAGQPRPRGQQNPAPAASPPPPALSPPPAAAQDTALAKTLRQVERQIRAYAPSAARGTLGDLANRQDAAVLVALGRILILERNYGEAEARLKKAAELDPAAAAPWAHLGETHLYRKSTDAAKSAFRQAQDRARARVEKNPDDAEAQYYLGWARQQLGDAGGAIAALEKASRLDSGNPEPIFQIGVCETLKQNWQPAVDRLTAAIGLDPNFAYAYFWRGQAASRAGHKDMLIADLQRFLELAPDAPEAAIARRTVAAVQR